MDQMTLQSVDGVPWWAVLHIRLDASGEVATLLPLASLSEPWLMAMDIAKLDLPFPLTRRSRLMRPSSRIPGETEVASSITESARRLWLSQGLCESRFGVYLRISSLEQFGPR